MKSKYEADISDENLESELRCTIFVKHTLDLEDLV
jgi:hypothetical protein